MAGRLQTMSPMRSLVVLTLLAGVGGYGVIRQLPEGTAAAEPSAPVKTHTVEGISFDGRDVPAQALRSVLTTKTGDALDRQKLEHDRNALEAELIARGFLAAKVGSPQINFDADDGAFVTYAVEVGRLYHVHAVAVTGAAPRDIGVVTIAAGDPVEADRLAHAKDALVARLTARGKRHSVALEVRRDDSNALVDVELAAK